MKQIARIAQLTAAALLLLSLALPVPSSIADESGPPGSDYEGKAFDFRRIRDDIYHAVGTDQLPVGCNGAVVINEDDVLVVDSHMTPAAAWALRRELRELTDKPIRYVVNTHFHTGGDVVVYLPDDKVLITGDLLVAGLPYMGDAYVDEWIDTLEALKSLDFDVILPGHGSAFEDAAKIRHLQAYLKDLWKEATALHTAGVAVEEAAAKIDMTTHTEHFPDQIRGPGVSTHAVARIYELLDGEP